MKTVLEEIASAICGFFFVIYVCLLLAFCKLTGLNLEDDF